MVLYFVLILVRQKCKEVLSLLNDPTRLREARGNKETLRYRIDEQNSSRRDEGYSPSARRFSDEDDIQRAIEESKRTAQAEERRRRAEEQS